MLYDVYQKTCSLFVQVWGFHVPWSKSVQPTVGQVIVYSLIAGLLIMLIKDLKY